MLFDEELEAVENNPIIKDLIELNIIENTDNLSFSDYLLLWLLTREENSSDKDDERQAFDDDYIEVDETITDKEYWIIKERLEDNGFIVTSALFDDEVLLLTIRSKCGKSYKFKVFSKGGVIMDDYEGNDYSESESDNEDSVEATADNNDANAELIETNDTNEANELDDKTTELVDSGKAAEETSNEKADEESSSDKAETTEGESSVSPEVRAEINEKSNYSPEVNAYINSVEELEIYQKAGLEEIQINGRTCLIRSDIDMDQVVDEFGMTNADLIKEGYAPSDQNGNKIAPLAELRFEEHRSSETYYILHDTSKESEINRSNFDNEREAHWKSRA